LTSLISLSDKPKAWRTNLTPLFKTTSHVYEQTKVSNPIFTFFYLLSSYWIGIPHFIPKSW
jgi:hypothetical protein